MNGAIIIVGSMLGAVGTYLLQRYFGISAVVASSLIGLSGALVGSLVGNTSLPAAIFCGSFVGMTSPHILSLPFIVLAGIGAGILFQAATSFFVGYGGKLGTMAFIAVCMIVGVIRVIRLLFFSAQPSNN